MSEGLLAFFGAVVGAAIGGYAAIGAAIGAARISRADALRDDMALFLRQTTTLHKAMDEYREIGKEIPWTVGDEIRALDWKIRLMLNTTDPKEKRLHDLLDCFVQQALEMEESKFYQMRKDVFEAARTFIQQEWQKTSFWGGKPRKFFALWRAES